uniref:heavy metal translocating P-type ATPase n=1 Tax=Gordonia sp. B7-2 TaxID=3420932 RepID=UPI003D8F9B71
MSEATLLSPSRAVTTGDSGRRWWSDVWAVRSVRWATAATVLFVCGLVMQVAGGPNWLMWALYLACYATGGWQSARDGLTALRHRIIDVDLLMIVAAIGAAAIGQIFDGALLIVIFATSGALEDVATRRTEDSVRNLLDLAPDQATRIDADGTETTVDAARLTVGEVIVIRPGERIAADATVLDGASDVDQSSITGEPLPVAKAIGDTVYAGTLNGTGALRAQVGTDPEATVVARIVAMVGEASATKATTQLFIEKVERVYSIAVVAATVALFAIPLATGAELQPTLLRAMTFMIVASPCAVVLATMPPLLSAIATAGRRGVLVKSAVAMEKLADIDLVALDKTGTITTGQPVVTDIVALDETHDPDHVLAIAAAAENDSEHPLGRAIVEAAAQREIRVAAVADFAALPGRGVRASLDGRTVEVLNATQIFGDSRVSRSRVRIDDAGGTSVAVLDDGHPIGVIGLHDRIRPEAASAISTLTSVTGSTPIMVTGDNKAAAQSISPAVGIDEVRADLLPQHKVDAVRDLQGRGSRVAVVGDGINDAPALATADIGIAMGHMGADLALATADVVIVRDDLDAVPALLALARRTRRVVIANLAIAATFIAVLVTWDLVGHLPLPLGVAGHEGSTILVALNGLRLLSPRAWPTRDRPAPVG